MQYLCDSEFWHIYLLKHSGPRVIDVWETWNTVNFRSVFLDDRHDGSLASNIRSCNCNSSIFCNASICRKKEKTNENSSGWGNMCHLWWKDSWGQVPELWQTSGKLKTTCNYSVTWNESCARLIMNLRPFFLMQSQTYLALTTSSTFPQSIPKIVTRKMEW